jgi:hypothetical protein
MSDATLSHDDQNAGRLLNQIKSQIDYFTGGGPYDETPIYAEVYAHSRNAKIGQNQSWLATGFNSINI